MTPSPKPANTSPAQFTSPAQTGSNEHEDEPSDPFPSFTPIKTSSLCTKTPNKSMEKTQFLRQSMTQRLSCVDRGWLERCQVFTELRDEHKPATGNVDLPEKPRIAENSAKSKKITGENVVSKDSTSPQDVSHVSAEKFPVHVDHTSGNADGETKPSVPEGQEGIEESSPSLETRKQTKKPRSRTAPESKDPDYEQKAARKKGRKRQRETEEGEEQEGQAENVQKKRRTKKEFSSAEEKPARKGRKKKGTGDEEGESAPEIKAPPKSKMPQENLLGEVDEEDVRAASSMKRNPIRSR